jgi:radical SAM protein with 4Fe4S-binding SPASM domain
MPFFDIDGKMYPCSYMTPMSFPPNELRDILKTNFSDDELFIDDECFNNCYIYPICPTCASANYIKNKSFKIRNKNKCRIQKLVKNGGLFDSNNDDTKLYYTIKAIKKITSLYLDEFRKFEIVE